MQKKKSSFIYVSKYDYKIPPTKEVEPNDIPLVEPNNEVN